MVERERGRVRRLLPEPAEVSVDSIYHEWSGASPPDRPSIAVNMVSSLDGRISREGTARGLGSTTDRTVLMMLRSRVDAVLFGAGTTRADRVGPGVPVERVAERQARGLAAQPLMIVVTASGDLPLEQGVFADPARAIVFVADATPHEAVARLRTRATVLCAGDRRPDPHRVAKILYREFGVHSLLCEGGPRLHHSLLQDDLVDDLFITLAPTLEGGTSSTTVEGSSLQPPRQLNLCSLYEHNDELFAHYSHA